MICKRGDFVIQRHNELRDLQADLLSTVCSDVEVEPVLQEGPIELKTQDWTFGRVASVLYPYAESYRDQEPQQIAASMKTTRSDCTRRGEYWMLSMARSRRLYLQLQ